MKSSRQKIREQARKKLGLLLELHGNYCHYCRLELVRGNRIHTKIWEDTKTVLYIDNGIHFKLKATVEHITRLIDLPEGKGNEDDNLTVACRPCNQLRGTFPDRPRIRYTLKIRNGYKTNMTTKEWNKFFPKRKQLEVVYKWESDKVVRFNKHWYLMKKEEIYKVGIV